MRRFRSDIVATAATAILGFHATVAQAQDSKPIVVDGSHFALNGDNVSYRFHADNVTGDLITDHFGGPVMEDGITVENSVDIGRARREFPDIGTGDSRIPALQIVQSPGYTVSDFKYIGHDVMEGKPPLEGLASTFGESGDVMTLVVHMYDNYSSVAADLSYSIFPKYDAIVRSVNVTNKGNASIQLEKLASFSVDLPHDDLDMIHITGDWGREGMKSRRNVGFGTQGFGSTTGFASHLHNPFISLVPPETTETRGEAYGFSLVYSGSYSVEVEKGQHDLTRAMLGLNPYQFSWPLKPGESFTTPECVAVFSRSGIGGMSRQFHRLYRRHLMRSKFAQETRPVLLNSWEGLGPDVNETSMMKLAHESADLGVKLLVMDDGWFGNKYPRISDDAGLGDWEANRDRFPDGLGPMIDDITSIEVANSSDKLKFGLWFEPEMVNPKSVLYETHPDWAVHAGPYPRTETRNQLILNLALPEVQEFVIDSLSKFLNSTEISYIKWDNNRGIHEAPSPNFDHRYILGVYRVFETLTSRFPNVLWEGCASGGGRFDPGILQWFPQVWTSDDTDAVERVPIQFGTSLVYPPSSMGAHISHVPNGLTGRSTPLHFRAHVAMMGGSFGLELNPADMDEDERADIPALVELAEKVNPIVVTGDLWRLGLPEETDHPAALFFSEDGGQAVLFAFQMRARINKPSPWLRLEGLDPSAQYTIDGDRTLHGSTLMNLGIQVEFEGDMDSKLMFLERK